MLRLSSIGRISHKVAAIGALGVAGLVAVAAVYLAALADARHRQRLDENFRLQGALRRSVHDIEGGSRRLKIELDRFLVAVRAA